MANLTSIPKNEQENVLASFWLMLRECENSADNDNNPVLKHQVEGLYKQWNRITGQEHVPAWEARKLRVQQESLGDTPGM